MSEFIRRLRYLLNRRRIDQELANDMEVHREMAARAGGIPFGNTLRLREESRDAWGWTWVERLLQDLSYGVRQLRRSPGFSLAAILMLAIGIGVNVAAFGFFNLMALRPMPVRDPGTLLRFKRRAPQSYASQMPYPEMAFFRDYSKTLSAVLAVHEDRLTMDGEAKPLTTSFVTANVFNELGAVPALGRLLDKVEDAAADAEPVVVLSDGFWQRHFARSPSVIGKIIRLNNKPVTVIGVASSKFSGLSMDDPDAWLPIDKQPYFVSGSHLFTDFSVDSSGVTMFGRLKTGVTASASEIELGLLAAQLRNQQHAGDIWELESLPSSPGGYAKNLGGGRHGSGAEDSDGAVPLIALAGTLVLLILAVACANLGNLLLARGVAREREMRIRTAVGAGGARLIRQLFTESLLLALLGSVVGLALGYFVLHTMMAVSRTPAWLNATPDWRVTLFAVVIGFAAAILFGLMPAIQVARRQHRGTRLRQILIGGQVAASCILIILAALLVRALDHALTVNPGFEYQEVVSIDPGLVSHGYSPAQARTYLDALRNRLVGVRGIESVSMSSSQPLGNKKVVVGINVDGHSTDIHIYGVDPHFFETMKIPMLRGRNLTHTDTHALVIGRSFALQWPTGDPLGRPFQMGNDAYTVIGVCGSARLVAIEDSEAVQAYYLASDADLPAMVVLVRASGAPESLLPFLASIAKSIDPQISPEIQLLKNSFERKMQASEYAVITVTILGLVALLLASLGIVGLVSYAVSQRTKEIGIRMALGAGSRQILSVVVRQLTRPVFIGLAVGFGAAAGLSQLLRRQLFGVSNLDPIAYLSAIAFFSLFVFIAALLPARRALQVDPSRSLRCE